MWLARPFAPVLVSIVAFSTIAQAVTLDWNGQTWTPGSLSNSFDVDPSPPGDDVTIDVTYTNYRFINDPASGTLTPVNNTSLSGGGDPTQKNLLFAVNLAKNDESITITISFAAQYPQGVQGVSFTLFDIDKETLSGFDEYEDQILSISATDGTTTFAPVITGVGSSLVLTGTGLGQTLTGVVEAADTGAGSAAGNATISFGSNTVTSITFTYGSGPNTRSNPSNQYIGLSDISFTPIPEINPAWSAVVSCLAAAALILRHRANLRK